MKRQRADHGARPFLRLDHFLWGLVTALILVLATACSSGPGDEVGSTMASETTGGDHAAMAHEAATDEHAAMGHNASDGAHTAHEALEATEPSGFSIYQSPTVWQDQTGAERTLESLEGKPVVVAMLYTNCAYACPRLMLDMKRIEGELGSDADEVEFVVVSIDPERDTPETLASFARGSRLDPDRWTLLTGDEGDVLELAAMLGIRYRETAPGEWVHSNLLTVLDPEGAVTHRQLGLGTDPAETLGVLRGLLPS